MKELLNESLALMPGRGRSHWNLQEGKTPIFNPHSMGMWVIRVEDYLYKVTGKKWTWKKPILTMEGGKKVQYKWAGRKGRGQLVPPLFTMVVEYQEGSDTFDVETAYFDGSNIVASKTVTGVYIDQIGDPSVTFGWVSKKWNSKTGLKAEALEEGSEDKLRSMIWKVVPTGNKMGKIKTQSRQIMLTGDAAKAYGVKSYTKVPLDGLEGSELTRLAKALGVMEGVESLSAKTPVKLRFQGKWHPVALGDASKLFRKLIVGAGYGSSELLKGDGDVVDSRGTKVAKVSYNGRLWGASGNTPMTLEGAPGPFAVSDNPPTLQDMISAVKEQIRAPSWTYPNWALPKVQLDESLSSSERKVLSLIARNDVLPLSALKGKDAELEALAEQGLVRWDLGSRGYAVTSKGRDALA